MNNETMKRVIDAWDTSVLPKNYDGRLWQMMEEMRQAIAEAKQQKPDDLTIAYMSGLHDGKKQRQQERNFCERCGKRLGKNEWDIHTCTLPAEEKQEPVALPCCGYDNPEAVKFNPHNQVVQCHNCGQVYTPQRQHEPCPFVVSTKEGTHHCSLSQRQPLTDEEIDTLLLKHGVMNQWPTQKQVHAFARAIEATHGIKGEA